MQKDVVFVLFFCLMFLKKSDRGMLLTPVR